MADRFAAYEALAVTNLKAKFALEYAPDHPIALEDRLIATVDRNTSTVNTDAYLAANIFGVLLECGSYYDEFMNIRSTAENPYYDKLAKQFQKSKFPYGIYIETRATSTAAAATEIAAISIAARRNTPTLGIWLRLRLASRQSSAINDLIINQYQKVFTSWGYENDMGLIGTTAQIQAVSWNQLQSSWLLWWESHVTDVASIPNLTANDFKMK